MICFLLTGKLRPESLSVSVCGFGLVMVNEDVKEGWKRERGGGGGGMCG